MFIFLQLYWQELKVRQMEMSHLENVRSWVSSQERVQMVSLVNCYFSFKHIQFSFLSCEILVPPPPLWVFNNLLLCWCSCCWIKKKNTMKNKRGNFSFFSYLLQRMDENSVKMIGKKLYFSEYTSLFFLIYSSLQFI